MKIYNILLVGLAATMLFFTSCEPIEDRDELTNSFNPDNIELEVIQSTAGGNELTIKMNTPGVCGYWDYNINKTFTDEVNVIYPIPGTSTFTYYVTTEYLNGDNVSNSELVSKTVDVTIDVLDHELPAAYYTLVGDDLGGKTWVFDGEGGDDGLWWYMSDPGNWEGLWWNAGGTCCPPADAAGKMTFNLDGAANYYHYADQAGAEPTLGSFAFNSDFTKLSISGDALMLGNFKDGAILDPDQVFDIIEFTDEKMILFSSSNNAGTGWVWIFKALAE